MVLRLKSNAFVRKTDFFVKNVSQKYEFFPEMTFFPEKKAPAAKLSHKQSKFSASPQGGIGSRQEQGQEQKITSHRKSSKGNKLNFFNFRPSTFHNSPPGQSLDPDIQKFLYSWVSSTTFILTAIFITHIKARHSTSKF